MPATTIADFWLELKTDASIEWARVKTAAAAVEAIVVKDALAVEKAIEPIVEAELVAIMSALKQYALTKVLELAGEEYAALSGQEKQSEVVTHLIQIGEGFGADVGGILITAARTLAQTAFVALGLAKPQ